MVDYSAFVRGCSIKFGVYYMEKGIKFFCIVQGDWLAIGKVEGQHGNRRLNMHPVICVGRKFLAVTGRAVEVLLSLAEDKGCAWRRFHPFRIDKKPCRRLYKQEKQDRMPVGAVHKKGMVVFCVFSDFRDVEHGGSSLMREYINFMSV